MGAMGFITTAKGRTAKEAFRAAVEDARHWNGHGGYTGTVAEKSDFIMIADTGKDLKARLARTLKGLRELQRVVRAPGRRNIVPAFVALQRRSGAYLADQYVLRDGTKTQVLDELRRAVDRVRELRDRCRARMAPGEIADMLIDLDDVRIDDKWGPAGCIDLTPKKKRDKEFLFFGMASC